MQEKLLKELQIANLLKVLEMIPPIFLEKDKIQSKDKLLDYIFNHEISELQYDQAFEEFKRWPQQKEYNFHGGDIFDGDC